MSFRLHALEGPLPRGEYALDKFPFRIGRRSDNDLAIPDPLVSRYHCQILRVNGGFRLIDIGSKTGLLVNGARTMHCDLRDGDEISVGSARLRVVIEGRPKASEARGLGEPDEELTLGEIVALPAGEAWYSPSPRAEAASGAERKPAGLQALIRLCASLREERDFEETQATLLRRLFEVVPAERGAILIDGESDGRPRSALALDRDGSPIPPRFLGGLVERVQREQAPCLWTRATERGASLGGGDARSALAAPLALGGRSIGSIYLETSNSAEPFTRDDLETAAAAAVVVAGALRHALRVERLRRKADLLEEEVRIPLAGVGEAFEALLRDVEAAAEDALPVLIVGESGVGKEHVAREIHRRGSSAGGPFAAFPCGSGRDEESADCLFGRGTRPGRIERAFDGVLFLDQVERLDPASRARLIEVLDRREYARPGGGPLVRVYARVMASATEDPGEGEAALDPELYHRLSAHLIHVPPLRERREDILSIAEALIGPREFSPDARRAMLGYDWPCNARELRNALLRAARARPRGRIELEDLPDAVVESAADSSKPFGYHAGVQLAKRRLILDALRQAGGRHQDAAAILGINRTYLHRLIRTLNLKDEIERAAAAGA